MLFSTFATYLERLEKTAARLEMTAILAELYKSLDPAERSQASYLLQGRLVPQYNPLEFQFSVKMLLRVLARFVAQHESVGSDGVATSLFGELDTAEADKIVLQRYKSAGDIGLVTATILTEYGTDATQQLSVAQVYEALTRIATEQGAGSQERKVQLVLELCDALDPLSAKYVARIMVGTLRLGFSTMTLLDSLSWAMTGSKSESALLETAYQKKADIGKLAETYLKYSEEPERRQVLENYTVEVGVPVGPQLCQVLATAEEVIAKMQTVIVEPKYDGLRVQIHINKKGIASAPERTFAVFTRNMEDATHMFPEIERLVKQIPVDSLIIDGEAIGYDPATGKLLLFQETITRKRKHDIAETAASVPLKFFLFDLIAVDGVSLLVSPLQERKDRLKKLIPLSEQFVVTTGLITSDPNELHTYHEEQLAAGLEGVVIKQVVSPYQSGRKGWYWVKMKHTEGDTAKLRDTLDCIILGYYVGRGKRTVFGMGAFLVGVLTAEKEVVTIAKIGTGISDEQLTTLKEQCDQYVVEHMPATYKVSKELTPDYWVAPQLVAEIAADEVTRSPIHTAGIALRFPRLVRMRSDKTWEDATTVGYAQALMSEAA